MRTQEGLRVVPPGIHSSRRSSSKGDAAGSTARRRGIVSMNIHTETTMLSARDVDMERSPTSTDGTASHADRSISNA